MVAVQGYVGPQTATGTTTQFRQDETGSMVTAPARAPMAEQTRRGLVFSGAIPPGTGQAPGTAIGTTACMTLANGATSTVRLVLYQITVGYISGTFGAGVLALLAHFSAGSTITAPSGGTAITPTNMLLGSSVAAQGALRFNNTVPASGLMIRAIANFGASLATTAVAPWQLEDNVNGAVVIGPGQAVSVQGIAAGGTSPLIVVGLTWAEEVI